MGILFDIASLTKEQQIRIAEAATKSILERLDNNENALLLIINEELEKEIDKVIIENIPFSTELNNYDNYLERE